MGSYLTRGKSISLRQNLKEGWTEDRSVSRVQAYVNKQLRKGDHKSTFPHYAEGAKITADNPSVIREFYYDTNIYNYLYTNSLNGPNMLDYWGLNDPNQGNSQAESLVKALSRLDKNAAQLGADIGEGKQTIGLFTESAIQIARALLAAKHLNWGAIPGILGMSKGDVLSGKFAANKWLEYQYGWKPLFGALHDYQQKVHELVQKDYIVEASASSGSSVSHDNGRGFKYDQKFKSRYYLKAKISNPALRSVNSWGLLNPLAIGWELVPFSFVVDWFMPVGNTLSALTAGCGLQFVDGGHTVKTIKTLTVTGKEKSQPNFTEVRNAGMAQSERFEFERIPLYGIPLPEFYADLTPFSTPRVANAAALLRQLV